MHETSKLQVGIYIGTIFIILMVVLVFLGVIPGLYKSTNSNAATLTFWTIYPEQFFSEIIDQYERDNRGTSIIFTQKDPATFETELLNALAIGNAPDIITIPDSLLHRTRDKLLPIPALFMTEREFRETYAGAAVDIFLQGGSVYGLPFIMDPMVLYWNPDIFASEGIALPPTTWEKVISDTMRVTRRTPEGNITRAGMGMGLTSNVPEVKDILSLLILQGGTSIVDPQTHKITLGENKLVNGINTNPTASSLSYYTDFSQRAKTSYSWNATFSDPASAFGAEDLAMFIGKARNLARIVRANPHVNAGVAPIPQYKGTSLNSSYARTEAYAVTRGSRNPSASWQFAKYLSEAENAQRIAEQLWLAPARRDLLALGHSFPAFSVMYEEALRARTWYDPDPGRTAQYFQAMVEAVLAGRDPKNAGSEAQSRLKILLQ